VPVCQYLLSRENLSEFFRQLIYGKRLLDKTVTASLQDLTGFTINAETA
jgi:hypothetical protein